jgi:hypothetical protein
MSFLTIYTSQQPVDDFSLGFAAVEYSATLAATTDTTLTIPGSAPRFKALIKVTGDVWVAVNNTAAVPAGATFATANSELAVPYYPLCREVVPNQILHFYAPATASVSVVLFAVGSNG